jgi:ABC-type nickel/cobalt efflux system permease component RcnA
VADLRELLDTAFLGIPLVWYVGVIFMVCMTCMLCVIFPQHRQKGNPGRDLSMEEEAMFQMGRTMVTIVYRSAVIFMLLLIMKAVGGNQMLDTTVLFIVISLGIGLVLTVIAWAALSWRKEKVADWLKPQNQSNKEHRS